MKVHRSEVQIPSKTNYLPVVLHLWRTMTYQFFSRDFFFFCVHAFRGVTFYRASSAFVAKLNWEIFANDYLYLQILIMELTQTFTLLGADCRSSWPVSEVPLRAQNSIVHTSRRRTCRSSRKPTGRREGELIPCVQLDAHYVAGRLVADKSRWIFRNNVVNIAGGCGYVFYLSFACTCGSRS